MDIQSSKHPCAKPGHPLVSIDPPRYSIERRGQSHECRPFNSAQYSVSLDSGAR